MKKIGLLWRVTIGILALVFITANPWLGAGAAKAAAAPALAAQIGAIGGLITDATDDVVNVSGTAVDYKSTITLNIDKNVTVNWGADISGGTASGKYLLNLSGGGTFNLINGAEIKNNSGIMTVTGEGSVVNIEDGLLNTPADGNGVSVNIAANNVNINVNGGGDIFNQGTNSAINVTTGVSGVKINVNGGSVRSLPSGYAINDGGTALCANNTWITVNDGLVESGSACAIKSVGAESVVTVLGGTVKNAATINSNPVIYMNGGLGDNVTIGGTGKVIASDINNLGFGIQTTGNILITGAAEVRAFAGRAVNLVGMDSVITVNGGLVTAETGTAICTATTNPATVANAKIIINGGVVSSTGDVGHGDGRAIYATGANNEVIINGGWVGVSLTVTRNETEAIYITGQNSRVIVNGGWVSAKDHFAIEAYSGGYVYINGGFVFSFGINPLYPKTGANIKDATVGAISPDRIIVNGFDGNNDPVTSSYADSSGDGVVVAWAHDDWDGITPYFEGNTDHLQDMTLLTETASWHNDGSDGDFGGVYYKNGDNSGFFSLANVGVEVVKISYFVTVINGSGTGAYTAGETVNVVAYAPPEGMEFDYWQIAPPLAFPPSGPTDSFEMPADYVTIEAIYKEKEYLLTVFNGSGGGYYPAGSMAPLVADPAPANMEFSHWEITGGAGSLLNVFSPDAANFQTTAADATVEAVYRDIPLYSFSVVGGTVVYSSVPPQSQKYPAGTLIRINTFSSFPAGYSFGGWTVVSGGGAFVGDNAFAPFGAEFIMPAADSQVSMNYPINTKAANPTLTVDKGVIDAGGVTSGVFSPGVDVAITAEPAQEGMVFTGWKINTGGKGIFADAGAISTKFRMSDANATVTAQYKPIEFALLVEYGNITEGIYDGGNTGFFITGETVLLTAAEPLLGSAKYRFDGWSADGGVVSNPDLLETSFTMPMGPAVVTAHWTPLYRLSVENGRIVSVDGEAVAGGATEGYFEYETVIVAESYPPPTGYDFVGWQSNNGGSFEGTALDDTATFIMPADDATIRAEYDYPQPGTYNLDIINGSGAGGPHLSGDYVTITADPPGLKETFAGWIVLLTGEKEAMEGIPNLYYGAFENAFEISTVFTMPSQNVTVIATYADLYDLELDDGVGMYLEGIHAPGERVDIEAKDHSPAEKFAFWASNDGAFVNFLSVNTTFVMPAVDAEVTALYAAREAIYYTLLTVDCHADIIGPFEEGTQTLVTITADVPEDKVFVRWDIEGASYAGIVSVNPDPIRITMPDNNVTVTAVLGNPAAPSSPSSSSGGGITLRPKAAETVAAPEPAGDVSGVLNTEDHMAYVQGIGGDLFAPDKDITRAETAQLFYNLLLDKSASGARTFPDLPEGAWYKDAVDTLTNLAVLTGRPDGLFFPEENITRAEFVAIAVRFTKETPGDKKPESFVDVTEDYWACGYIETAVSYGWIQGVGGGYFEPGRRITRAEAVTMVNRMLDRIPDRAYINNNPGLIIYQDVSPGYWAYYDIAEASNPHGYTRPGGAGTEEWN